MKPDLYLNNKTTDVTTTKRPDKIDINNRKNISPVQIKTVSRDLGRIKGPIGRT